jgi:hypothetical protein
MLVLSSMDVLKVECRFVAMFHDPRAGHCSYRA